MSPLRSRWFWQPLIAGFAAQAYVVFMPGTAPLLRFGFGCLFAFSLTLAAFDGGRVVEIQRCRAVLREVFAFLDHRACGHSACSQHYIDTGSRECVEGKP